MNAPLQQADSYQRFLEAKVPPAQSDGIDIDPAKLSPWLKPHCRIIVPWAVRGGRRAIFARFGLHKTAMQLDTVRLCVENCPHQARSPIGCFR